MYLASKELMKGNRYCKMENLCETFDKDKTTRKKAASRSMRQSSFTFFTPKKRTVASPYVPPHRRTQNSNGVISPKTSSFNFKQPTDTSSLASLENDFSDIEKDIDIDVCNNEITDRILDLTNNYVNTEFKEIINELFIDKYGTYLPDKLLKRIKFCVLLDDKDTNPATLTCNNTNFSRSNKNVINSNSVRLYENETSPEGIGPHVLKLENTVKEFWITIYNCNSVTEIRGPILDSKYFGEFEKLAEKMELFYEFEGIKSIDKESVKEGSFYAVFDGSWHRVKCIKYNDSTALVYFIDRGDQDTFPFSKLYLLDRRFCSLPVQAIRVSLPELEIFSDSEHLNSVLDTLLFEMTAFAEVNDLQDKQNTDCVSVQLFLNKTDEEIINVNDFLMKEILENILDPKAHIEFDKIMEVKISYASETRIFIKLIKKPLEYFEILMKKSVEKYLSDENFKGQTVIRYDGSKIYLVKNNEDEQWYRAKALKLKNKNEIEVLLIDVGTTIFVKRENLILLEKLCSVLAKCPKQVIEVQLDQLSVLSPNTLDRFRKITRIADIFQAKFIKTAPNNNLPSVQLYKKTQNGVLACINDALIFDMKIPAKNSTPETKPVKPLSLNVTNTSDSEDYNFMQELKARLTRIEKKEAESQIVNNLPKLTITTLLNPPTVPEGSYFDVHVVLVHDPSRFVVQLLRSRTLEFLKMVCEMSKSCNSYKGPALTCDSIQVGQIYACKNKSNDKQWYRAYVTKMIGKKTATVYYCDYGNYKAACIENLVPLEDRFFVLPCQAIWANLHGVKSVSDYWTLQDCIRFRDLVLLKNFVCIVKSKKKVVSSHRVSVNQTEYELELIDTSTDEDIYVADVMIQEGRALPN